MPEVGVDALNGKEEYINGRHIFIVTDQTSVNASGMFVSVTRAGQEKAEHIGKTTGKGGWTVRRGDEVTVYNVTVVFGRDGRSA